MINFENKTILIKLLDLKYTGYFIYQLLIKYFVFILGILIVFVLRRTGRTRPRYAHKF